MIPLELCREVSQAPKISRVYLLTFLNFWVPQPKILSVRMVNYIYSSECCAGFWIPGVTPHGHDILTFLHVTRFNLLIFVKDFCSVHEGCWSLLLLFFFFFAMILSFFWYQGYAGLKTSWELFPLLFPGRLCIELVLCLKCLLECDDEAVYVWISSLLEDI